MKKLTKEQEQIRNAGIDWFLAQKCFHASHISVWSDYSPTSDWREAGPLIEKYSIDIKFFGKELNPTLEHEWMGGLQMINKKTNMLEYYTAFGPTPLIAAMTALVLALES